MTPVTGTTGRTGPTAAALRLLLTRNYRLRLNLSLGFNEYLPRIASPAAGSLSKPVLPLIDLNPKDSGHGDIISRQRYDVGCKAFCILPESEGFESRRHHIASAI